MNMTIDQFYEAEKKLRTLDTFLELDSHKLESPQYSSESVKYINNFASAFGGRLTQSLPDLTTDMGFGDMYFNIYCCRNQSGIVTVKSSTGNIFANEIGLYRFTESEFKETINDISLSIKYNKFLIKFTQ